MKGQDFFRTFDYSKPLSLYVHIPFCVSKCAYCAFYSVPCGNPGTPDSFYTDKIHSYVLDLVSQIDLVTGMMNCPFYTAYIGGGNPGCLSVADLEMLCSAICRHGRPVEFTVEMNPESLSSAYFGLFGTIFTRLSMGIQSLDSRALEFLGRNVLLSCNLEAIPLAMKLQQERGVAVSFDMITCLPAFHNPVSDLKALLSVCKPSVPDHLSVYALTAEEGTPLYGRVRNLKWPEGLPSSDRQAEILLDVCSLLEDSGFEHYEVSNYAGKGGRSLHNSVYWSYGQYMGLGESACSRAFGNAGIYEHRITGGEPVSRKLTEEEALEEFVLMGLRHRKGLDLTRLYRDFANCSVFRKIEKRISALVENRCGFSVRDGFLVPDDRGMLTADAAALSLLCS